MLISKEPQASVALVMQSEESEEKLIGQLLVALEKFLKLLNADEDQEATRHEDVYTVAYNLLITLVAAGPLKPGNLPAINGIIEALLMSPFEARFETSYLCEQGSLTADSAAEVFEEFAATSDAQKRTFFDGT